MDQTATALETSLALAPVEESQNVASVDSVELVSVLSGSLMQGSGLSLPERLVSLEHVRASEVVAQSRAVENDDEPAVTADVLHQFLSKGPLFGDAGMGLVRASRQFEQASLHIEQSQPFPEHIKYDIKCGGLCKYSTRRLLRFQQRLKAQWTDFVKNVDAQRTGNARGKAANISLYDILLAIRTLK